MRVLVTGSNGQLGNEIRILSKEYTQNEYFFTDVQELDITDKIVVDKFVSENDIDCIVNCAAYTNVDKAEDDEAMAYKINAVAVKNLAEAAGKANALLIHISTDYVFDGNAFVPYREIDKVNPQTAYGRTKLAGEQMLQSACPTAVILRTAWLYSTFGNNFVKTMIRLGSERNQLSVVYDQIGSPTYAADLAQAVFTVICNQSKLPADNRIFHFTNEGVCSWYDFTKEIHRLSEIHTCDVQPIRSEQYTYKTPRPHYSVLDKQKFKSTFSIAIPHWKEALERCIKSGNLS